LGRWDVFKLLPSWSFFAPSPANRDSHIVVRDLLHDGTLSAWSPVSRFPSRDLLHVIWHPAKRPRKILRDATGTDCLTVNPIGSVAPFTIKSVSIPLPVSLSPNEHVDVIVEFAPVGVGTWNNLSIPVTTSPVNGDTHMVCSGSAVAATFKIAFTPTAVNFGKVPLGQTPSKAVTITNTGSKAMNVSSAGVTADGFTVGTFSTLLTCGQAMTVNVAFAPATEGPHSASVSVTHSAPGNPTTIPLSGEGCVANAEITVPPTAPIDFGQIQQGFRMVRIFNVGNPADGPLTFQGSISGPDAALFGLPDPAGSVINPPAVRNYVVDPVSPCGNLTVGSGTTVVAIAFFADVAPKVATATLTISGHNASNFPPTKTWVFPLSAEIKPPVALDVALVVDRSDSMNNALGSRVKIDAAISASQLFLELLRPNVEDRIAVVRFNNDRNVVQPMTAVSTTVAPTQDQIRQQIDSNIRPATGLTAIAGGTMLGIHEVEKPHPGNPSPLNRAVVVLTDGIENTAFEEPAGNWLSLQGGDMWKPDLSGTIATNPVVFPAGIDRYAIGGGKAGEVNPAQLQTLTGDPQRVLYVNQDLTGMLYFQLEKYFTQIFMNVVGLQGILDPMFWIAPGDTQKIEFEVLAGDVEAMIVIYDYQGHRLPFYCLSPAGEIIDPSVVPPGYLVRSAFTGQARVVHFKMPQHQPKRYSGTWTVVISYDRLCRGNPRPDAKEPGFVPGDCGPPASTPLLYGIAIGVGSDFRMFPFVTPSPVFVGDPIQLVATVAEAGLPVTGCQVTVEATVPGGGMTSFTLADDGAHGDGGEYARSFTKTVAPGIYHFKFRAIGYNRDGQQVVREAMRDKPVLERGTDPNGPPTGPHGDKPRDGVLPAKRRLLEELLQHLAARPRAQ
jgi:hypothetical protein